MSTSVLKYQSVISVGGTFYYCVESYESIFGRMRESNIKVDITEEEPGEMTWAAPLELTCRIAFGEGGSPSAARCAVSPQAIGMVFELPEDQRVDVE